MTDRPLDWGKKGYDGKRFDMWSLGIMLHILLFGSHPFAHGPLTEAELSLLLLCSAEERRPVPDLQSDHIVGSDNSSSSTKKKKKETERLLASMLDDLQGREGVFDNEQELWTCVRIVRFAYHARPVDRIGPDIVDGPSFFRQDF